MSMTTKTTTRTAETLVAAIDADIRRSPALGLDPDSPDDCRMLLQAGMLHDGNAGWWRAIARVAGVDAPPLSVRYAVRQVYEARARRAAS